MKDLELTLVVRNNRLKERRDQLGLTRRALAEKAGINQGEYGALEALRRSPLKMLPDTQCLAPGCEKGASVRYRVCLAHYHAPADLRAIWRAERAKMPPRYSREWTQAALRLSRFWRCLPEDLFPEQLAKIMTPQLTRTVDVADVPGLGQGTVALALPPDTALKTADARRVVESALSTLTQREERVLRARFGLDDGQEHSLDEIAVEEGVGKERIRQIECKALRRLRIPGARFRLLREANSES